MGSIKDAETNSAISIVCEDFSSSSLISSGVKMTYWSRENSYPLTVWSRETTWPSFWQMYCWRSREPQSLWSMLKETLVADSAAEYSLTGIETMPNETVAVAIARGAIMSSAKEACIH